jgi:hypothetical protein
MSLLIVFHSRSGTANRILEAKEKERNEHREKESANDKEKAKEPARKRAKRWILICLRFLTQLICLPHNLDHPRHQASLRTPTHQALNPLLVPPVQTRTQIRRNPGNGIVNNQWHVVVVLDLHLVKAVQMIQEEEGRGEIDNVVSLVYFLHPRSDTMCNGSPQMTKKCLLWLLYVQLADIFAMNHDIMCTSIYLVKRNCLKVVGKWRLASPWQRRRQQKVKCHPLSWTGRYSIFQCAIQSTR